MSSYLRFRPLCFHPPTNIEVYDFHDNLFVFYSEEDSKVHSYDVDSLISTFYDQITLKSKSHLTSISISPSHSIIAFGYICGTILLFSPQSQKVIKVIKKLNGVAVLCLSFISDDYLIVSTDDAKLTGIKIASSRFVDSFNDSTLATLCEPALKFYAPPIYQFYSVGSKPKLISKFFDGIFVYKTTSSIVIADASNGFDIIFEHNFINYAVINFSPVTKNEINIGVATPASIEVFKITENKKIEVTYFFEINFLPNFITFFAPTIFIVVFNNTNSYFFSLSEKAKIFDNSSDEIHSEKFPEKGYLVSGRNNIYLFSNSESYQISMITFFNILDKYKEEEKFDEALAFCKRAIAGDYNATVGLPYNSVSKNNRIEEAFSHFLDSKCKKMLKDGEIPSNVIKYFLKLSFELKFHNWMITKCRRIFEKTDHLNDYFREIISADREANYFLYDKEFVTALLRNSDKLQINSFLLCLSKKVTPPQELIEYAKEKDDTRLLADIMIYKLNNYIDAAAIFWNKNDSENLVELYHNHLYPSNPDQNVSISLISWLFGVKKIDDNTFSFPHLICLLQYQNSLTIRTIEKIVGFVESTKKPFGLNEFSNALLNTLSSLKNANQNNKNPNSKKKTDDFHLEIFEIIEKIVLNHNICITNNNLPIVFSHIFLKKYKEPDNREALLVSIINGHYPISFKEMLLPLCDNFNFRIARRQIQIETNKIDSALKEVICSQNDDLFSFVRSVIRRDEKTVILVRDALIANATFLVKKDVKQFVQILQKYFKDLFSEIINIIDEDDTRNIFIKCAINAGSFSDIKMSKNVSIQYCNFLCKYYPDDVHQFLEKRKEDLTDFYPICKSFNVFDGCAIISEYTNDIKSFSYYLSEYLKLKMILLIDSPGDSVCTIFEKQSKFALKRLRRTLNKHKNPEELDSLCKMIIESFVLPFYALQSSEVKNQLAKTNLLKTTMKNFCVVVSKVVSFPELLRYLVNKFENIYFEYTSPSFLELINDAAYDLQTTTALMQLFHQDEQNAHNKFILKQLKGICYETTTCRTCGAMLNGINSCIRIFPCGHAFHDNNICLPKQICPICNPEVRIDQDVERPVFAIQGNQVQRRLKKFEFFLNQKEVDNPETNIYQVPKKGSIRINRTEAIP